MVDKEEHQDIGRIEKVIFLDEQRRVVGQATPSGSKQLDEDPFHDIYDEDALREPPYSLEALVHLAEKHPIHSTSLEQKAMDIIGSGWKWDPTDEGDHEGTDPHHPEVEEHFKSLAGEDSDETMLEILHAMQLDFETTGQGYLEVVRDKDDVVTQLVHMPAHTVRIHKDKTRYAQIRSNKKVWFKKWGTDGEIDYETGKPLGNGAALKRRANEILVFRKPTRRSSYYGIPMWISATGWIQLALAARDYNILFFENNREPRWAIILTDVQADKKVVDTLRDAFSVDLRQPHRNLIVPIAGGGNVKFQKLGSEQVDATFQKLLQLCDDAILQSHRVPPERIGAARTGPLGGNVANVSNKVYREGVIRPSQALVESRLNRFIATEFPEQYTDHKFKLIDLDLTAEDAMVDRAVKLFRYDIIMRNEARQAAGYPPLPEEDVRGKQFMSEVTTAQRMREMNEKAELEEEMMMQQAKLDEINNRLIEIPGWVQPDGPGSEQGHRPPRTAPGEAGPHVEEDDHRNV